MENMTSSGLSAGDVMALTRSNNGAMDWSWIIGLLVIAGIFSGNFGGWGNNASAVTTDYIDARFNARDIFSTNQNVSNTASATQMAVQDAKYDNTVATLENRYSCSQNASNTQKEVLENRYANALGFANAQKDTLLGNAGIQSQMASCCCELKSLVRDEAQAVKDLINNNTIQDLRDQLNTATVASANAVQTQNILGNLGRFYINQPINPYYAYGTYGSGTTIY